MVRLGIDSGSADIWPRRPTPSRCRRTRTRRFPEAAPKLAEIKLIDYDFAKYGSSDERKRLLSRWDKEIGAQ